MTTAPNQLSRPHLILSALSLSIFSPIAGIVIGIGIESGLWKNEIMSFGIAMALIGFGVGAYFIGRRLHNHFHPTERLFNRFLITGVSALACCATVFIVAAGITDVPAWLIYVVGLISLFGIGCLLTLLVMHGALSIGLAPKQK